MQTKARKVSLGSVSHATMRPEYLIPAFLTELKSLGGKCKTKYQQLENLDRLTDAYWDSEEPSYDLETLFDALNELAPPYVYFGAHEGDGSDYGFWPSIESVEEACRDGEMLKVNDTSEVPEDYTGEVCHVNDHGNMTLYSASNGELTELWSCV